MAMEAGEDSRDRGALGSAREMQLLRGGLLDGVTVATAGGAGHVAAACAAFGAATPALDADLRDEDALAAAAAALAPASALVVDAAPAFRDAGAGLAGLRAGLDGAWNATRAVVNGVLRPAGGGKVVLLAPRPGDGDQAAALRAALENTARTCAIEWARYGVRTAAVLPGDATSDEEVAALCAYLVSRAGDYYSGCAFTLGAV
jgi:NAD(P)-dependent dehydrogenase (short-subunit alcohol dehydrogenase family)